MFTLRGSPPAHSETLPMRVDGKRDEESYIVKRWQDPLDRLVFPVCVAGETEGEGDEGDDGGKTMTFRSPAHES